tara:strand:- start:113 stop:280 length:168 start_codon:yes stop_codon:yes gene_type:complete
MTEGIKKISKKEYRSEMHRLWMQTEFKEVMKRMTDDEVANMIEILIEDYGKRVDE